MNYLLLLTYFLLNKAELFMIEMVNIHNFNSHFFSSRLVDSPVDIGESSLSNLFI